MGARWTSVKAFKANVCTNGESESNISDSNRLGVLECVGNASKSGGNHRQYASAGSLSLKTFAVDTAACFRLSGMRNLLSCK
jgi:hypothetical protein